MSFYKQPMKYKHLLLFLLIIQTVSNLSLAQQPTSPLMASFAEYQQMKAHTSYNLEWIQIGPTINSARAEAIQADPTHPGTMYVAFGSGNLWKTINNGLTWKPIFENQPALGIGDIALAPSDPNILYVGTGESLKKARNFTMPGTGIYRSDDAGETWRHLGLNDSWHIGEIAVHPTNPDIVMVAVLGHFWSDNPNRGVYRTDDGGQSWQQVLYVDEQTGATDIVIAPSDPNVMYAAMWQHSPEVSGKKSGVYKSTDGGKTWKKAHKGMPVDKDAGRIGLAVSYTNPNKVYALMDHRNRKEDEGAAKLFKSLDGGISWEKTHADEQMFFSVIGWYFTDLYVNPQDDEEIFGLGVKLAHSTDGGKTIDFIGGDVYHLFPSAADPLHLDHCELWINPLNPNHLALANDGGLYTSYDKGKNWTHHNNIPTGEFYDITLSNTKPYTIYGGTQDDATVYGPSKEYDPRYHKDWQYLWVDAWSGGDGCVTCVDPEDPNTVYFSMQNGAARRRNMQTGRSVSIRPRLPEEHEGTAQFNFVAPYFISPHDHNTLYHAGNYVFKSTDRGDNWQVISGDLALSADPDKKSTAAGALAESALKAGLLYMGTDKGAFWTSKDDGATWTENSEGLPNAYIRSIYPSRFKASRVYLAMTGINYDDLSNYLFVSEDYGQSWTSMTANLPNETANVIMEDPENENLIYAGLYRGVYISADRGQSWSLLGSNMPAVSVADLAIDLPSGDLVVATHGRGIYKVNLGPIRKAQGLANTDLHLFSLPEFRLPRYRDTHRDADLETLQKTTISYYLSQPGQVEMSIVNDQDSTIWTRNFDGRAGINEYRWDLITERVESNQPYFIHYNRFIRKGSYKLRLRLNGKLTESDFEVKAYED
jgi:photosystem II stability/assembly factor-like uncharacterized protein